MNGKQVIFFDLSAMRNVPNYKFLNLPLCVGFIFPHFAVSWIDLNDKKIEQEVNKFWDCEQNWFFYYAQG